MTKESSKAGSVTSDSLQNVYSGLGGETSKRTHNKFSPDSLWNYPELEFAYQSNWIARKIVDIPADDMTREWREIKSSDAEEIRQEEDRLALPMCVNDALSWARLYGGAAILMLTNQDLEKPLRPELIRKGDLKRLIVLDRYEMFASEINTYNILAENYLEPEFYNIYQGNQRVHWTHFVKFYGSKLPRRQRVQTLGWGDSVLRKCLEDVKDIVSAKGGLAELMQEANVDVINRNDLAEDISTDQGDRIVARYAMYSLMKSNFKLSLLDGDETLTRHTLNLSGVAPVLDTFFTWISGAADIPETRFFGSSAKGLNATGEGDQKNYYDGIRSLQNTQLDRPMSQIDQVLVRSATGRYPSDFNYDWRRLYQLDRKAEAEAMKMEVETDIMALDSGLITRPMAMRRLQATEVYHYDDKELDSLEKTETLSVLDIVEGKDKPKEGDLDA
ncbi:hypothetical protein CASP1_00054 [Alcaligenes phage CASP1]|nr:hypothetical protein CASP1_00054 [Alcaligenes phage CASP1]